MDNKMGMGGENKTCMTCGKGGMCGCGHHSIVPVLMILFAMSYLLEYQGILMPGSFSITWPILVGIAGISKLMAQSCKCC